MSKLTVYSEKGVKSGSFDMPNELKVKENTNLLSQAFYVYQDRSHKGTARVKTRSEVNATGAKMYKQKGTGGARHGDKKAPIFSGGGIAHGPKGVKRLLKLSNSQKKLSLAMAISGKANEGRIVLVDKLSSIGKTKEANMLLNNICSELNLKRPSKILVSFSENTKDVLRNFRNIEDVRILSWNKLNAYEVLSSHLLITEKEAFEKGSKSSTRTKDREKLNAEVVQEENSKTKKLKDKRIPKKETTKKITKSKTALKTAKKPARNKK